MSRLPIPPDGCLTTPCPTRLKRALSALIALNVVLLLALAVVNLLPTEAQAQGLAPGGDYIMIAGQVKGRNQQDAVYIVELRSAQVAAVMYNSNSDQLEVIATRDLTNDVGAGGRR